MSRFAQKIKELRSAKRMSQAELGDIVGVTRAAVQQWERGTTTPSLENLSILARFFDISLAQLLGTPDENESVDAELRELPSDVAAILKQSFLTTIRTMKPPKKI
jgi:transcriptional regulator with XRE-family HTH domain